METVLFVFTLGILSFQGFSDYLFKWYMDKGTVALSCCWLVTRIRVYKNRARNNGRSTDNVRTDCGFDRSKFNRIENEINLRFLLFSCYLSSRCVLRNFDMKSWWHATRAVVYDSRIETDIGIRPLPVKKLPNISTFISDFQFFMLGLWAPKRVIHHIHLTG